MTPYSLIFKKFLHALKYDPIYAELDIEVTEEDLLFLMDRAIVNFEYPKVNLKDKDDASQTFNNELGFDEIEILVVLMAVEWSRRQVYDVELSRPSMTPQEFRTFSNSNQLDALVRVLNNAEAHARRLRKAYSNRDESGKSAFYRLGGGD